MRRVIPKGAHLIPKNAERVFKGIIFDVYQWQQPMYDGRVATFEMLRRPDTVLILGVKGDKIIMVEDEQPHYGVKQRLPGGRNDVEGEDELACAKREMHEETGMVFKTWRLIDAFQRAAKIEAFVYTFLATDFERQDEPHVDGGEKIKVLPMTFKEALQNSDEYETIAILERAGSVDGLLSLPEFTGDTLPKN